MARLTHKANFWNFSGFKSLNLSCAFLDWSVFSSSTAEQDKWTRTVYISAINFTNSTSDKLYSSLGRLLAWFTPAFSSYWLKLDFRLSTWVKAVNKIITVCNVILSPLFNSLFLAVACANNSLHIPCALGNSICLCQTRSSTVYEWSLNAQGGFLKNWKQNSLLAGGGGGTPIWKGRELLVGNFELSP